MLSSGQRREGGGGGGRVRNGKKVCRGRRSLIFHLHHDRDPVEKGSGKKVAGPLPRPRKVAFQNTAEVPRRRRVRSPEIY